MRSLFWTLLVGVGVLAATTGLDAQNTVQLFASVVDASGAPAAAVQPADIRLLENDAEATITKVEAVNWPVKLQLLLDNGAGLGGGNLNQLRNGARSLIEALPQNLEITIVTTAPQPRFLARPTTDRAAMLKSLDLLAPDSGTGRFVESINEATQRIEKDKTDYFPVIIVMGTTLGDRDVRDNDVKRLMQRLQARPTTVHVVMFNPGSQTATGGGNQVQVGTAITQMTGGRYEGINSATRIATLLSELGAQVAKAVDKQSHQFRITVTRPAGASGDLGRISAAAKPPLVLNGLSLDGRVQ